MCLKPFALDAHAADIDLELETRTKRETAHIGVGWQDGSGKYKLTKVVNLTPRYLLKNMFSRNLYYREYCAPPTENLLVEAGKTVPLYLFKHDERKLFTFAFTTGESSWYGAKFVSLSMHCIHNI